jgi:hypothetical protein
MKTRNGFVSNSSSSSFIIIIGKETADKIIETLDPFVKETVEWLKVEEKLEGKTVYIFEGFSCDGGSTFDEFKPSKAFKAKMKEEDCYTDEYFNEFETKARAAGGIYRSYDF